MDTIEFKVLCPHYPSLNSGRFQKYLGRRTKSGIRSDYLPRMDDVEEFPYWKKEPFRRRYSVYVGSY